MRERCILTGENGKKEDVVAEADESGASQLVENRVVLEGEGKVLVLILAGKHLGNKR